jgi:CcmD family protein
VTTAEKYVTAAYCVIFAVVLLYVAIIALKLQRLEREVDELVHKAETAEEREQEQEQEPVSVG